MQPLFGTKTLHPDPDTNTAQSTNPITLTTQIRTLYILPTSTTLDLAQAILTHLQPLFKFLNQIHPKTDLALHIIQDFLPQIDLFIAILNLLNLTTDPLAVHLPI